MYFYTISYQCFTLLLIVLQNTTIWANAAETEEMQPPNLDDEQKFSPHMPAGLVCESCRAITYQLAKQIWTMHKTVSPPGVLKDESTVIDAMEKICDTKYFQDYGAKEVNGIIKLNGPGLEAVRVSGMMYGGGPWAWRLSIRCQEFVGESDEYELYRMVVEEEGNEDALFANMCRQEENPALNSCGGDRINSLSLRYSSLHAGAGNFPNQDMVYDYYNTEGMDVPSTKEMETGFTADYDEL